MFSDELVACNVAICVFGFGYEDGARVAVMVKVALERGVTKVCACPASSVRTVQEVAPPQADSAAVGEALNCTLAPRTGAPLGSTTDTRTGLAAWLPTGVAGFAPISRLSESFALAP